MLAFGTLDASAVECMQEDTQRVIARYRSQHPEEAETAETATTAADSRRVAKPRKDPQAREAAELRRQSRFLENWSRRTKYWDAGPGRCALCSWEGGGRVQCGICCRCVCGWCHVPEHAICQQCRVKSLRAQMLPLQSVALQRVQRGAAGPGVHQLPGSTRAAKWHAGHFASH